MLKATKTMRAPATTLRRAMGAAIAMARRVGEETAKAEKSTTMNPSPSSTKRRSSVTIVGIYGHFSSECRKPKKERVYMAEKGDDGPVLLMLELCELMETKEETTDVVTLVEENIQLHLRVNEKDDGNVWYLDTSASNHMTGCRKQFTELIMSISGTVKIGDGFAKTINGRGTVLIEGRTGEHKALTGVYYIPKLTSNIISLGQLKERDDKVVLEDGHLCVFDRQGQLLVRVKRARNRLYILNLDLAQPVCFMARLDDDAWRWHMRYGHLNF